MGNALRALRHRNYRLFYSGQLISLIGTWTQTVAESWLVYRLTGSPVLLGAVAFANQFPVFLLSPLGGAVADRFERRRILVITQIVSMVLAFILAALTLTNLIQVWHVMVLAVLLGAANAFDIPARQTFAVDLVSREDLPNAIAVHAVVFNGARMVGPAIAGALVAVIGEGWCFVVNGASYIAVLAGLMRINLTARQAQFSPGAAVQEIVEGFRFAAVTLPVRSLLLLLGVVSLTGLPYTVLMPIIADTVLNSGSAGMGVLMGAAGMGALSGAVVLALRRDVRGLSRWVAAGAGGFGTTLMLFGLSPWFWLSATILYFAGFFSIIQLAASNTLLQSMVPDELRGRVMALYSMVSIGMGTIGSLGAGVAANRFGAPTAILVGGAACVAAAAVFASRLATIRPAARQLILAQQMEGSGAGM